jgi:hypothetical protein
MAIPSEINHKKSGLHLLWRTKIHADKLEQGLESCHVDEMGFAAEEIPQNIISTWYLA